ncbi:hypothetical protein [Bradyrhizobium sp. SZCCHNRI2010]|uniref:hypothetical protein n=1 Tax=Bradyrhizobium sp. SZCCHNRI2010 TaxID=3057283 RepID=UPI0028E94611|nr:hypothetical protein [Bradyrhizobium sp. SZCCHNRI2010]
MDILDAERLADQLIATEIAKQDAMWGKLNERAATGHGELMHAGMAQLDALFDRQNGGGDDAFSEAPMIYPENWSGFRDYGSDVANLVVAIAFLRQEVKRKLLNGEDYTRTSRRPDQPYNPATGLPNTIEA